MLNRPIVLLFNLLLVSFWLTGCKESVPREYIQPDKMEDILYDYHLAVEMVANGMDSHHRATSYDEKLYKLAVLKKYGVDEKEFDESMVYYMRHADRMEDIYKKLSERIKSEATKIGANTGGLDSNQFTEGGDTANIWKNETGFVLLQKQPYNVKTFSMEADTSYHKGDRLVLTFSTLFLYQEGFKNGTALLAIRLDNDSIASRYVQFSSSSRYRLELEDKDRLGIKEVRGFISLQKEQNAQTSTTLKLLVVDNIQLLRMHVKEVKPIAEEKKDSASLGVLTPSPDSLNRKTPSPETEKAEPLDVPERRNGENLAPRLSKHPDRGNHPTPRVSKIKR